MRNSRNRKATIQIVLGAIATFIFNTIVLVTFINLNYLISNNDGVVVLSDNIVLSIFPLRRLICKIMIMV
jgi:hypothetical protein